MPDRSNNNEEPKDENLQDQTTQDDVLPAFKPVLVVGGNKHTGTASLDHETQDIAADEDLGDPGSTDERVLGRVCALDETAQNHVDRGGEEDGGQEDESGLDDVGRFGSGVTVCCGAGRVAYRFALWGMLVCDNMIEETGFGEVRYTYCSANNEWNAKPCPVLDEPEDVNEEQDEHDDCGDYSSGDSRCVRPEHVFWGRRGVICWTCRRHGG
jgi:hypothetical protein